ncbi:MAG TPA: HAMP domain-containing sensor histidine kinase [Gemmatimonadaceae bacterium]|nr:HAMP domain-containing sensor histidine kinase [Gemmatimonadaceae bacterium]
MALDAPPGAHEAGWAALVRVARAVPAAAPEVRQGLASVAELEPPVIRLCAAVGDALSGRPPALAESQALLPLRPLLDALRRGFLAEADALVAAGAGADVVPVLRAIERVQEALSHDSAQRLAARMAEGDAMNLVVEVAHDMRSPLSSILFLVERIRRGQSGPVTPVQERQLGLMYSAAFGLGTLASDVMELARGGDRLVSHRPLAFSVQEIVQAVRDVVQPMAEEKRLELVFGTLDPDWRVGYPQALNRVLLNLVTNALKFTNEGRVTVTPRAMGRERVEFVVEDTGRGIPQHVMATLFDAFRRRQTMGDYAFSSAGLGLSICRKLISAMGGELRVETELERGTRFRFELEMPPASRY